MKIYKLLTAATAAFFLISCGGDNPGELNALKVKGGKLIADIPANIIKQKLLSEHKIDKNTTVFGYRAYKISYKTTDDNNKEINASGVMIVPTSLGMGDPSKVEAMNAIGLDMVLDCHGTIFSNAEAPSVAIEKSNSPDDIGVLYSSIFGFVTLEPDYIGFGDSIKHYHPYLLKKSSANTVADFVKAALKFAKDNNISIVASQDLYLSGYSQGGYVAMSAVKKLEKSGINLKMVAPMAGPYDLNAIASAVLNQEQLGVPSFMAATAYAYAKAYDKNISSLIKEPYASKLPTLFNGSLDRKSIDKELTKSVSKLFTNDIVALYRRTGFNPSLLWFPKALTSNSIININPNDPAQSKITDSYVPKAPIEFIHCKDDDVINYQLSVAADNIYKAYGANSKLNSLEIPYKDNNISHHVQCAPFAYKMAADKFATDRYKNLNY